VNWDVNEMIIEYLLPVQGEGLGALSRQWMRTTPAHLPENHLIHYEMPRVVDRLARFVANKCLCEYGLCLIDTVSVILGSELQIYSSSSLDRLQFDNCLWIV
jgi:hypothetical protein